MYTFLSLEIERDAEERDILLECVCVWPLSLGVCVYAPQLYLCTSVRRNNSNNHNNHNNNKYTHCSWNFPICTLCVCLKTLKVMAAYNFRVCCVLLSSISCAWKFDALLRGVECWCGVFFSFLLTYFVCLFIVYIGLYDGHTAPRDTLKRPKSNCVYVVDDFRFVGGKMHKIRFRRCDFDAMESTDVDTILQQQRGYNFSRARAIY